MPVRTALVALLLLGALAGWSLATSDTVHLPPYGSSLAGVTAALTGLALFLGPIDLVPYSRAAGFCMLAAGIAMTARLPSALWLVCPALALFTVAYGFAQPGRSLRWLPEQDDLPPTPVDVFRTVVYSIVPWLVLYHVTSIIGVPQATFRTNFQFEDELRIWEWTIFLYETSYPAVGIVPFISRTRNDLRQFAARTLVGSGIVYPLYWTLPGLAPRRPFDPQTLLGQLLDYERGTLPPVAAFPSFHVIWSLICAEFFAARWPRARWIWRAWAWAVAASCISTAMHTIADVVVGFLVGWITIHYEDVWRSLVRWAGSPSRAGLLLWNAVVALLVGRLLWIGAPIAFTLGVLVILEAAAVYAVTAGRWRIPALSAATVGILLTAIG